MFFVYCFSSFSFSSFIESRVCKKNKIILISGASKSCSSASNIGEKRKFSKIEIMADFETFKIYSVNFLQKYEIAPIYYSTCLYFGNFWAILAAIKSTLHLNYQCRPTRNFNQSFRNRATSRVSSSDKMKSIHCYSSLDAFLTHKRQVRRAISWKNLLVS